MPIVDSNGIRIHYAERGSGEPLVLLMGLGADGSVWEEHVRAYERHYRCILVDNRGAGRSSAPEGPYTTAMMAADTIGLLDALGIESAHISGISMGSAIAQEIALAAPQRIRSLSLNCSWSACDRYSARIFGTFRASYAALAPYDFQQLLQLFIFTPEYHETKLDDLRKRQEGAADRQAQPMAVHAFQAQCDACVAHNTVGRLANITAPALITAGDRDIFTPLHLSRSIAAEMPHAEFEVFEGSGHTHHWDRLERFNEITLAFIQRQEASRS